nr:proteoglycan Cow-like [Procambarus clarkii]
MVVADVHVPADDDDCASDLSPVLSSAEGSPQWWVVAPPDVGGVGAGAGRDLVLVLKKDARRGGSLQVIRPVDACQTEKVTERYPRVYAYNIQNRSKIFPKTPLLLPHGGLNAESSPDLPLFYGGLNDESSPDLPLFYGGLNAPRRTCPFYRGLNAESSPDLPLFYGGLNAESSPDLPLFYRGLNAESSPDLPLFYRGLNAESSPDLPLFYRGLNAESSPDLPLFYGGLNAESSPDLPLFYRGLNAESSPDLPLFYRGLNAESSPLKISPTKAVMKIGATGRKSSTHTSKKERQRERHDAYISKLRATKDEPLAQALSSDPSSSDSSSTSSSSTASSSSFSRAEDRDNSTRGRLREGQQQARNRDNGNRREKHNRDGEKYANRVRSRLGRVKNNYKKFNGKYKKENYRQMDKYNAQRRQWTRGNNEATHKATNTVWGPNECTQEALEAMGNRMLDWFSVIMADTRSRANAVTKAPSWCKPEVSWMLGHLDNDGDGRLSVKELYQLEHDDHERCIKPFIDRCDLDRDIFLSAREWCKCFDKSERPCAALRKASKGLLGGYIPECDSEGYYQGTQCHAGAGVCWCVDRHGVELPKTRTRGTPNCEAVVNSEEVSNYVDDDAEDGDDELDVVEGSADMPLDI